jgi:hypothetical protein
MECDKRVLCGMCRILRGALPEVQALCDWLSGQYDGGGLFAEISGGDVSGSSLSLTNVNATNNIAGKSLYSLLSAMRCLCDDMSPFASLLYNDGRGRSLSTASARCVPYVSLVLGGASCPVCRSDMMGFAAIAYVAVRWFGRWAVCQDL